METLRKHLFETLAWWSSLFVIELFFFECHCLLSFHRLYSSFYCLFLNVFEICRRFWNRSKIAGPRTRPNFHSWYRRDTLKKCWVRISGLFMGSLIRGSNKKQRQILKKARQAWPDFEKQNTRPEYTSKTITWPPYLHAPHTWSFTIMSR